MKLAVFEILSQKNVISETLTESTIAINTSKIIEVYDHEKGSSIKIYTSPRHIGYVYVSESKQQVLSQLGGQTYNKELSLRKASRGMLSITTNKIYFAYSVKERTKISYFNGTRMTSASLKMTMEDFTREYNSLFNDDALYVIPDRVGIGTTEPQERVHIYKVGEENVRLEIESGNGRGAVLKLTNTEGSYSVYTDGGRLYYYDFTTGANRGVLSDASGRMGVGTTTPVSCAILDLTSTAGGIVVPRMTTIQRNALAAVSGLIVYDTDLNAFYFYENGAWGVK